MKVYYNVNKISFPQLPLPAYLETEFINGKWFVCQEKYSIADGVRVYKTPAEQWLRNHPHVERPDLQSKSDRELYETEPELKAAVLAIKGFLEGQGVVTPKSY